MNMRVSTASTFSRILLGMRPSQLALARAQEQISSGRRISRPSDDPGGTARAIVLRNGLAHTQRVQDAIATGRTRLDSATATLEHSSELMARARELMLQAMGGILNEDDRQAVAAELEEIREQLLDNANLQVDGSYVFSGTATGTRPWEEVGSGSSTHAIYRGNGEEHLIQAGEDVLVSISGVGNRIFGRTAPGNARFDGLTGVRSGLTADEGTGYAYLTLRHDATEATGLVDVGMALVNGGQDDTFLGANALVIDGTAGTIRLGNGTVVNIPGPGERSDLVLRNEQGGELHVDLEGWTGGDYSETILGRGSISMDGTDFTPLDFSATDLELRDASLGQVLHVDTTGVLRAGSELVTFGDSVNPFDLLQGIVDDLHNEQALDPTELQTRLSNRLANLDQVHDDMLVGLGVLGARSARLINADQRQGELAVHMQGRLSDVEDVDFAQAVLDLQLSQQILQLAQAAGSRVMQTSLLNFL